MINFSKEKNKLLNKKIIFIFFNNIIYTSIYFSISK